MNKLLLVVFELFFRLIHIKIRVQLVWAFLARFGLFIDKKEIFFTLLKGGVVSVNYLITTFR